MDAARDRFAAAGCSVLVVSQARPEALSLYIERQGWRVPIVADPEKQGYAAFGLERTGWLTFFRPKVLWGYFRGMSKGYGVKKPAADEDLLQLGGNFILDRRREVVFSYPSADPTDRPSVADLLAAIPTGPSITPETTGPPPDGGGG